MSNPVHISCRSCLATNRVPEARLSAAPVCGRCRKPLFSGTAVEVDEAGFQRLISNTDLPVVIDFWAEWCGPCKMMAPVFQQAAQELEPDCLLVKVNTEQAPSLANQFQIRSIPTLMIMHQGREVSRQAGAMNLTSLVNWVRSVI